LIFLHGGFGPSGKFRLGLGIGELQTMSFLAVVFGNEASLYALRAAKACGPCPAAGSFCSSVADVLIAFDIGRAWDRDDGIAGSPCGWNPGSGGCLSFVADIAKFPILSRLKIA